MRRVDYTEIVSQPANQSSARECRGEQSETDQLIELPPTAIDPSSAYITGASGPALNPTYIKKVLFSKYEAERSILTHRSEQSMSRLDNMMTSVVKHEATGTYKRTKSARELSEREYENEP